ncbi:hypothetical protein D3C72_2500450 [compost metagenome]
MKLILLKNMQNVRVVLNLLLILMSFLFMQQAVLRWNANGTKTGHDLMQKLSIIEEMEALTL